MRWGKQPPAPVAEVSYTDDDWLRSVIDVLTDKLLDEMQERSIVTRLYINKYLIDLQNTSRKSYQNYRIGYYFSWNN